MEILIKVSSREWLYSTKLSKSEALWNIQNSLSPSLFYNKEFLDLQGIALLSLFYEGSSSKIMHQASNFNSSIKFTGMTHNQIYIQSFEEA